MKFNSFFFYRPYPPYPPAVASGTGAAAEYPPYPPACASGMGGAAEYPPYPPAGAICAGGAAEYPPPYPAAPVHSIKTNIHYITIMQQITDNAIHITDNAIHIIKELFTLGTWTHAHWGLHGRSITAITTAASRFLQQFKS